MISAEALYSRAAKLPRIEITKPDSVIGKNTVVQCKQVFFMDTLDKWKVL